MIKILLLAPRCYPVDGAEAIVNIKLLRALCEDGEFEIDLISRKNLSSIYPSDTLGSYGVNLHNVHLIENHGGFTLKVLYETILSAFIFKIAFPGCHWAVRALPIIKEWLKENHYDFVLTKSSPSFILGAYLKMKMGLKWVASWNDPYPESFYPSPYGKGKFHKPTFIESLQIRAMREADYHIFPSSALQNHMQAYLNIPTSICQIAPHVVFETNTLYLPARNINNTNVLRIIHSGNLAYPRNPLPFISAFYRLIKTSPKGSVHLTILGKIEEKDKNYIESITELDSYIDIVPAVEYKKSLELLAKHDMACIIEADCGEGGGVFLPTKVTDFMQIEKPIFAISPKGGVLEELYKEKSIGYFSDIHNEESIYKELVSILYDFQNGSLRKSHIPNSFRPNSIVNTYKQIAFLLSNI